MANTFEGLVPSLIAGATEVLRQNVVTPSLVNRSYNPQPGQLGSTVDVPIPAAVPARAVTPSHTPADASSITPTTVPIQLDQWFVADFFLTDKEKGEIISGVIPMQLEEAVKSLANKVDEAVLGLYKKFPHAVGTAGTTPFASNITVANTARKQLNLNLAPTQNRYAILDPSADANAMDLATFRDASQSADSNPITEGRLGRKLGMDWFMCQNVPVHTAGTSASITCVTANAAGVSSITLKQASGTGTLVAGDIITFAGHSTQYVVESTVTLNTTGVAVGIYPPTSVAIDGTSVAVVVTKVASHTANLIFQRNAIALASRPLEGAVDPNMGVQVQTVIDPVTQLAMRLEIGRQNKRTVYSLDILFGVAAIRRDSGIRLLG